MSHSAIAMAWNWRIVFREITKAGNNRARRVLIEGAWTYRLPARVSPKIQVRLNGLPRTVREIAWKGQIRTYLADF